ncbi:hypothetical protein DH2020_010107 [Rehmannia glutinosa]|uniref:Protein kinase domain-containing protein n=1 Tax=Rehmannia glutinosa TaxID=99300 RepID=A0ABR0X8S2_REHGL
MSAVYDNWERLVAAVLKKQQLWQLFHDHSRSPSVLSEASDFSSSFNLRSPLHDLSFDFARLEGLSRSQRALPKVVLISDFSPVFDIKDVYMVSAELLGRGTFGSAYAAAMNNGVRIVVKRLKSTNISELDFKQHMDIVGDVRHENVAALRAYYCSEDERLMLYDYYSTGSVYALLHGQIGENKASVDWETRLKIAIGAARGIAEIHMQNGGKLVHGNIRASNIFCNPDQYGCVSDLGLTNLIQIQLLPAAKCYAPEVKNTKHVSQASDVYSFGILLLELLTRKPSVHVPGGPKAVDLVKLVKSIKNKEKASKVFDADLLNHPNLREQMIKMLQIGIKCVEKSIKKRPKISEVVKMLEEISVSNPVSHSPVQAKLVFIEDANATFDLENMLRASAEVLGKGTFWTSYKAILENGNTIVVKRLREVIVALKDFQKHMEVIGRMRHENIAEVRAYYISKDEKLLVYDYFDQDSVSALLHGHRGIGRTPLDWETRLKIAVGAARGIAHIHTRDGRKLVHGNIKSSNIFLDGQKYGIVSDAGLTKLTSPIRPSGMPNPAYCAPEVTDTRNVSQASDIYSFGVVLLELLCGKRPQLDDDGVVSLVNWVHSVVHDEWTAEVIDLELLRYENEEEKMVQVLQIAMDCVDIIPGLRPRMSEVVKMLEEISGIEPPNEPSTESRLEYILEDLLPTLTLSAINNLQEALNVGHMGAFYVTCIVLIICGDDESKKEGIRLLGDMKNSRSTRRIMRSCRKKLIKTLRQMWVKHPNLKEPPICCSNPDQHQWKSKWSEEDEDVTCDACWADREIKFIRSTYNYA